MNQTFNFQSSIKDVQNRILSQNLRQISNIELLNSEEAIRNVIKSYIDRFQTLGGMLIDINNYIVQSKEIIKVNNFNDLFEGIYIDLVALYGDIDLVDQVLTLNLQRNKVYFLNIKKRIRDLWNKLNLTRSYIYDSNPTDESYFESFFTDINSLSIKNMIIDKKNGYMYLLPVKTTVQNKSQLIKNITSITYPVRNDNGGVYYTTSELNTFEDNYKNGPRDMLENGLWKEEVLVSDIPSILLNIGSTINPIKRSYKGIVSLIDIEYVYPIEFNRIDFDLFGDKPVTIDAILYKEFLTDEWKVVNFQNDDPLTSYDDSYNLKTYSVNGSNFDILTFYNIEKVRVKYLRIVLNQNNYEFLTSDLNKENNKLENKIQKDLEERRYELVHFNSNITDIVATPIIDENVSLYNTIISIIESTSNIESILKGIEKVLLPQINVTEYDFNNTIKFEIGTWSIEPKLEQYESSIGVFDSVPYKIKDRTLISASLNTKQTTPGATTCNWYINVEGKNIPIIENSKFVRKEPIYSIDMSSYSQFSDWKGTFVLLDFPIDPFLVDRISLYTNGVFTGDIYNRIVFLNSRLIFLNELKNSYGMNYVIRYPVALYNSVNLYTLVQRPSSTSIFKNFPFGIISTNKDILLTFIKKTFEYQGNYLSQNYSITNSIATVEEAKSWFGEGYQNAIFVANEIKNYLSEPVNGYGNVISYGDTKLLSSYNDVQSFMFGNTIGNADLSILSSLHNIAPIPNSREL